MSTSLRQVLPNVRNGQLKLIAVGAPKRSPVVPDTPTIAVSGYPEYDVSIWWGVSSPARGPRPLLAKLRQEITAVLDHSETRTRLAADAAEPVIMAPADIRRMIHAEVAKWHEVAQRAGIRVAGPNTAAR